MNVLGYSIMTTNKSPFDALTKDDKTLILTSFGRSDTQLAKRAKIVTNISNVVKKLKGGSSSKI